MACRLRARVLSLLAAALRRMGACRCTRLRPTRRRRRWWRRCWLSTRTRPGRRTECAWHSLTSSAPWLASHPTRHARAPFVSCRNACALPRSVTCRRAAQDGKLPLHVGEENKASEAVLAALRAADPDLVAALEARKPDSEVLPLIDKDAAKQIMPGVSRPQSSHSVQLHWRFHARTLSRSAGMCAGWAPAAALRRGLHGVRGGGGGAAG